MSNGTNKSGVNRAARGVKVESAEEGVAPVSLRRSEVNEYTKDYTPEQFMGDTTFWTGSVNSAQDLGTINSPDTLEVKGITFNKMGTPVVVYDNSKVYALFDYQSDRQTSDGEYPVLQIGVELRKFRGKTKARIVRDSPTAYSTKFW